MHRVRIALSQVKALLRARPGNRIPSISTVYAQARRRFTQVIHMVVHSKAVTSSPAGPVGSNAPARPVPAAHDRHPGRHDLAWAWMTSPGKAATGTLAAHPAGQAARVPNRLPSVTLNPDPAGRA